MDHYYKTTIKGEVIANETNKLNTNRTILKEKEIKIVTT